MKTSSIAVETSRSTTQSDSIVRKQLFGQIFSERCPHKGVLFDEIDSNCGIVNSLFSIWHELFMPYDLFVNICILAASQSAYSLKHASRQEFDHRSHFVAAKTKRKQSTFANDEISLLAK